MPSESNEFPAVPRRRPKLHPDPPPPAEEAPPPRQTYRLRQDRPAPSDAASKDRHRDVFFINWKANNPHGEMGSEEFERAYGDFQLTQGDARRYFRDRKRHTSLRKIVVKLVLVAIVFVGAFQAAQWVHGVLGSGKQPPSSSQPTPKSPRER